MSKLLINIPLDLETLGTDEDAAIIQIGCCIPEFDRKHIPAGVSHEFEATINYETARELCRSGMFTLSDSTMSWWETQDTEARKQVFSGQDSYTGALDKFVDWITALKKDGADVAIWGNGSDFDNRLLSYTLSAFGYSPPVWSFRNNRDLRTLRALFPIDMTDDWPVPGELKHTALGDARYEARLMQRIWERYAAANIAL